MLGLDAFRRKPRQFEYKPLHYDPRKGEWNERRKELLGDDAEGTSAITGSGTPEEYTPGSYIRARGFRRESMSKAPMSTHVQRHRSLIRGAIALLLLFLILVYILAT